MLLCGLGLTCLQAQNMYVKQNYGTQTAYSLSDIQKMSFSSGNITVSKTTGNPNTYFLSGIRYLNFHDLSTHIVVAKKLEEGITLYPNPVVSELNIRLSTKSSQLFTVQIFSIEGRLVYQEKLYLQSDVYQINVSALAIGLYICKLSNGSTVLTTKFFKQ